MKRLQKKCFLAATGFHLLLLIILLVGPAFLSSREKPDDSPVLDFVPMKTIDAALSGGGNPHAAPPAPALRPQPPVPRQVIPPAPRPEPEEKTAPSPERVKRRRELPDVSTEIITRSRPKRSKSSRSVDNSQARIEAQQRAALDHALDNLREGLSSSTEIEIPRGPGGGGPTYANFYEAVKTVYFNAWVVPDGVTDDEATTTASVTIARDGSVVNAHIIRRSGNALADQSVEAVLRRVRFVAPLPEDKNESQRTVTIKFNVKARRGV